MGYTNHSNYLLSLKKSHLTTLTVRKHMAEPILFSNKAITLDLGASGSTAVQDVSLISMAAVQEVYTGTAPTGTIIVEGSNDGVNFNTVDSNAIVLAGSKMVRISPLEFVYLRVSYTRTSGTGTLTVNISGKIYA